MKWGIVAVLLALVLVAAAAVFLYRDNINRMAEIEAESQSSPGWETIHRIPASKACVFFEDQGIKVDEWSVRSRGRYGCFGYQQLPAFGVNTRLSYGVIGTDKVVTEFLLTLNVDNTTPVAGHTPLRQAVEILYKKVTGSALPSGIGESIQAGKAMEPFDTGDAILSVVRQNNRVNYSLEVSLK